MQPSFRSIFVVGFFVLLVAAATRVAYLLWPEWTGFGEKTLWDLLELLIIPAVLGFGALWLNQAARDRERETADDQQREEALQNYLDKMAELLLEKKLLKKKDDPDDPVVDVAQVRTVTTLRVLKRERRNVLFQFLQDASLADFILAGASLAKVDLSNARMSTINLSGANLSGVDLAEADLHEANLSWAALIGANLTGANLFRADLSRTLLRNKADLSGAKVSEDQLAKARTLEGATMPDGTFHE